MGCLGSDVGDCVFSAFPFLAAISLSSLLLKAAPLSECTLFAMAKIIKTLLYRNSATVSEVGSFTGSAITKVVVLSTAISASSYPSGVSTSLFRKSKDQFPQADMG